MLTCNSDCRLIVVALDNSSLKFLSLPLYACEAGLYCRLSVWHHVVKMFLKGLPQKMKRIGNWILLE